MIDKFEVYKYIDENGIPFRRMSTLSISINRNTGKVSEPQDTGFSFELSLPFKLSKAEQIDVVRDYIFDLTGYEIGEPSDLEKLKSINEKPFILEVAQKFGMAFCVAFKNIPGSIIIRGDKYIGKYGNSEEIKSLGSIERIKGDLGLSYTKIEDLGSLQQIDGDFWFSGDDKFRQDGFKIQNLTPLMKVKGNVSVRGVSLKSLSTLEYVGGNLSLRYSDVRDLGKLNYVGGNLLIRRDNEKYYNLDKIEVKGKIRRYKD